MRIYNLIEKYRKGNIRPEELKQLSRDVSAMSDSELSSILEQDWMKGESSPKIRRAHLWTYAAAGILLIAAVGLSLTLINVTKHQETLAANEMKIDTGNEDKSRIVLPDGTKVILNAKSTLTYRTDFGIDDRKVRLSGQGYFDVAKDPEKKFIVSSSDVDIIVHGTKFNVYAYPENDLKEVSLIEGSVCVHYGESELMLAPNEKVCIRSESGRMNLFRTDNSIETSWMEDDVVFINRPLYQVIDILQRRFGTIIECSSEINLADRYTGSFNDHRIEDILEILKMHYGFIYERRGDRIIIKNQN